MTTLPKEILDIIAERCAARVSELRPFDIEQNSDSHIYLAAFPIARDVIVSVVYDDAVVDQLAPWINRTDKQLDTLAAKFARDMVNQLRPPVT